MNELTVQYHGDFLAMASCENVVEKSRFTGSEIPCDTLVSEDSLYVYRLESVE